MKEILNLIKEEERYQQETIDLIPSENYASQNVLNACGSVFMNRYSEGEINKRYYPGNKNVDILEDLCKTKAKKLFKLDESWDVNVQTLSGTPANLAVYFGLLEPSDKILSMGLTSGGHLSHGHKVNISSKIYEIHHYGVNKDGFLDYEEISKIANETKPKLIVCGATAYSRVIDFKKFSEIAKTNDSYLLADISHIAGLVSADQHPSPFPYADVVTTTTHKTLRGPRSAVIYFKKDLKVNRAVFPGMQGGPHENTIAAKAIAFHDAMQPEFKIYQKNIVKNAKELAKHLINKGFDLVTKGTDNHLILIDLTNTIDAMKAQDLLEQANILANRNTIPNDKSCFYPSGLRLGTPAVSSRNMKEAEMEIIANMIYRILIKKENPLDVKQEVLDLCKKFPI
jgi:glycine hydroxymethyltransferase